MNADQRVMRLLQGAMTRDESAASLARLQDQWTREDWGLFALERRDDGAVVGFCGLAPVRWEAAFAPKVEIGWRLAHEHWGHGYATEAAGRVLDWVFNELRWPEIISFTREENYKSHAVMQRLGMRREPEYDFDLPIPPKSEGGSRHLFYRLRAIEWSGPRANEGGPGV